MQPIPEPDKSSDKITLPHPGSGLLNCVLDYMVITTTDEFVRDILAENASIDRDGLTR